MRVAVVSSWPAATRAEAVAEKVNQIFAAHKKSESGRMQKLNQIAIPQLAAGHYLLNGIP
jgi:hypothetical protein